jgi:hypothetical protein
LKFFSIRNRRVRRNCDFIYTKFKNNKDIPTRIEFIAGEELEEKGNMKAGDIRMLLSESTGIQTQQTSATSANASIRIQGLTDDTHKFLKTDFPYCRCSKRFGTFANATA